jgi:hypothetical protein
LYKKFIFTYILKNQLFQYLVISPLSSSTIWGLWAMESLRFLKHGLIQGDPQLLEVVLQLGGGADVLGLEALLHDVSKVLNWVEIWLLPSHSITLKACLAKNTLVFLEAWQGVCATDLWLDTSTNGLKQDYTSPQAIYSKTYFLENVHLKVINNF